LLLAGDLLCCQGRIDQNYKGHYSTTSGVMPILEIINFNIYRDEPFCMVAGIIDNALINNAGLTDF
jgi:hypothetical protein